MKSLYRLFLLGIFLIPTTLAAQDTLRTWTGQIDSDFANTLNWLPAGPPEGTHVVIPQASLHPVLSTPLFDSIRSLTILRSGRLDIAGGGQLNTLDSVRVDSGAILFITSGHPFPLSVRGNSVIGGVLDINQLAGGVLSFFGKMVVLNTGILHIADSVNISTIDDDVLLNGSLIVDPGAPVKIWCRGDWIRGGGSTFGPGASTFYFLNPSRQLNVDRGTFSSLILGPVLNNLRVVGNVNVLNNLVLRDTVVILPGDTLTISNRSNLAIIDSLGGRIARGKVRRAIDTTSTARIRFHDPNIAVEFLNTGGIPEFIMMDAQPETTFLPSPFRFVRRFYDIDEQGGGGFRARLTLRYERSELDSGIVEDSLRLWRTTNNGTTWLYVPSRVDMTLSAVIADSVTEFSKWSFGTPASSPIAFVRETRPGTLPEETALSQNYPNPFNPRTTLAYSLAKPAFVTLKVYNVIGQEVESLVEGERQAGVYLVEWNPVGVPSGVYFYRLSARGRSGAESFIQTRKMILLK